MVANNLESTVSLILTWEGSEVNQSPTEPGGISKYGISLTAYAVYCKEANLPVPTTDTIANLTQTDAENFYGKFWLPRFRFNDLPSGVDLRMADLAVNLGVAGACDVLEMILQQFPVDGEITDVLLKELEKQDPSTIIQCLSAAWIAVKHTSPNWYPTDLAPKGFGLGWTNRNIAMTEASLKLVVPKS